MNGKASILDGTNPKGDVAFFLQSKQQEQMQTAKYKMNIYKMSKNNYQKELLKLFIGTFFYNFSAYYNVKIFKFKTYIYKSIFFFPGVYFMQSYVKSLTYDYLKC